MPADRVHRGSLRGRGRLLAFAAALVLAACSPRATAAPSGPAVASTSPSAGASTAPSAPTTKVSGELGWNVIPQVVATVEPSVVTVIQPQAEGSGVVWGQDGVIVTNNHVVEGNRDVTIVFADGERSPATVLATDPLSDLAVVRAQRKGLPAATFATSIPPVGSLVVALGNPLGFENSATAGIISGMHRAIPGAAQQAPALVDLVQTDAAISPGNSGGALVDAQSEVVGINVAYIPPSAGSVSIGFAIPSPTVTDVVGQLLQAGKVEHAYLGIQPISLTPQLVQQLDIKATQGAVVAGVGDGSPAAAAGIQAGDVITAIDDTQVVTAEDVLSVIRKHKPGDKVTIHLLRGSDQVTAQPTLAEFPAGPVSTP